MDRLKPKKDTKTKKIKWLAGSALVIAALGYSLWQKSTGDVHNIDANTLLLATVEKGDLVISVDGYGQLESAELQLVPALTAANVKTIKLRAGAVVTADSVIAVLTNPELEQAVQKSRQALNEQLANIRQLKVNQKIEDLNQSAELKKLEGKIELAALKTEAQSKLVKAGIISQLDYKE
ncbi:efflux RND transporter periplasmic adaptor subunit [Planctobacterium marinum]|uniref:hypothetical protein n=1 Tax=Planctobacterium marinum TaxID=1631968 RepID=UPI001E527CA9|nr:hypothetical protein [Planctobacterium marinum]MCC2607753.1 hypothetical protein [Planctobacterium marinum]